MVAAQEYWIYILFAYWSSFIHWLQYWNHPSLPFYCLPRLLIPLLFAGNNYYRTNCRVLKKVFQIWRNYMNLHKTSCLNSVLSLVIKYFSNLGMHILLESVTSIIYITNAVWFQHYGFSFFILKFWIAKYFLYWKWSPGNDNFRGREGS